MEEEYAYGAHFALRVLVLPVAPLRKKEYERQLSLLKQHSKIALADIPPSTTGGKQINPLIAPTPASRGFLSLNFVESWDADLAWLNEYQVHRRVMGVVGLLDCAEWTGQNGDGDLQDGARAFREILKAEAPAEAFATRCYAFNPRENQSDNAEGLVVIPNVGDLNFYINTLLAELASNMLAGVSQILEALNGKIQVQMPMGRPVTTSVPIYQPAATPGTPGTEQRMSLSVFGTPTTERSISPIPIVPPSRSPSVTPLPGSPGGPSTPGETSDAKARKKHPGRLAKLKGDLLCLAGKHQEAMASYNEATLIGRAQYDYGWQAAAIEANIMTQSYQSWLNLSPRSTGHSARPSLSNTSVARNEALGAASKDASFAKEFPTRYMDALSLYLRSAAPTRSSSNNNNSSTDGTVTPQSLASVGLESDSVVHPLVYAESCMRCLRMQLALLLRGGSWDGVTASLLVSKTSLWPRPSAIDLLGRTLPAGVSKADAQLTIMLAYSQMRSTSLRREDRIQYLEAIIQVYDALHLIRRKAAIQRELAVLVSTGVTTEKVQATEMDLAADVTTLQPAPTRKLEGHLTGNEKVIETLQSVCRAYGLPDATNERNCTPSVLPSKNVMSLLETVFNHFGWLEIQYAIVREGVRVSDLLPDLTAACSYTMLALQNTLDAMATKEQRSFLDDMRRLNSEARTQNLIIAKTYWGPEYPLLSMQILGLPAHLRVVEQILKANTIDGIKGKEDFSDLLVHSVVRGQVAGSGESTNPIIIAEEPGEVSIRLQNPYSVPLQVDSIDLIYSGVNIAKFPPVSITLPPLEQQTVTLICTPIEPGELIIRGCQVHIAGCPAKDFLIPTNAVLKGEETIREMSLPLLEHSRLKCRDFQSWYLTRERILTHYNDWEDFQFLACKVIPKQPLLQLKSSSLNGAVAALYEGEVLHTQLELANTSNVHITSMKVQLEDNVSSYQKGLLSQEGISPLMAYELELDMQQYPVLRVETDLDGQKSAPDGTTAMTVHCLGKPGLTQGIISLEYASLTSTSDVGHMDRFYTRKLQIPLAFKVAPCLRCQRWDVWQMSRDTQMAKWRMRQDTDRQGTAKDMLDGEAIDDGMNLDDADAFLLALEVTNLSPVQAFEAVLTSSDSIGATVEERIEPNTTVTMLIPIAKIRLSEEQKLQPLPVLSNRQFVIGKNVLPPLELERFWLRDELLRTVCLSWREGQSRKTGACNLRHLSLSNEMLSAIQLSDISLKVEVRQDGELCSRDSDSRWEVEEGSFTELSFRLQNLKCTADFAAPSLDCSVPTDLDASAARPVRTSARLEPRLALQQGTDSNAILRNVILDGNPIILLSSLDPGQESESAVDFSLCFMSKGTFIVDIILEEEDQDMTTGSIAVDSARIRHSVHFNVS